MSNSQILKKVNSLLDICLFLAPNLETKMKNISAIITVLLFNISFSQTENVTITGKWIKYKEEIKDHSKPIYITPSESTFLEYSISKNKLCINSNPILKDSNLCVDAIIENNLIKTSPTSSYIIESIKQDSLILSEQIEGITDDRLNRFYFVRARSLFAKNREQFKNEKNIIASLNFTPKTVVSIEAELNKIIPQPSSSFELIGKILIFPKESKIETQVIFSSKKETSKINTIKKMFDSSFQKWDLNGFVEFETIEIPFILRCIKDRINGIKIIYLTNDLQKFHLNVGNPTKRTGAKSQEYFIEGLKAYDKKEFAKAIEYFDKSYNLNYLNIDALYNKAKIYFESGDKKNACKTWKKIMDLGQASGKELYETNCN